ncbi:MAG: septum formation protein Maf [Clostridiales bacterium]|nr:septum formation protein Maf [Clostridiales bacterium]
MKIVLASTSPRRIELLKKANFDFEVISPCVDESIDKSLNPSKKVENLSFLKAKSVFERVKEGVVIGADTVVSFEDEILEKPIDLLDAKNTLKRLSGKTHLVITGITFYTKNKVITKSVVSKVKFKKLTDEIIDKYVKDYNVLDKAGSYAIQDDIVVESFEGSYSNIVGMPMEETEEILKDVLLWQGTE